MKKTMHLTLVAMLVLLFSVTTLAGNKTNEKKETAHKAAIENLLVGLSSNNYGLKTSSAYVLGELKAEKAVIPLMRMLHNEKTEDARIVAALSLYKIGNPVGIYAVKMARKFDSSERVRKMCSNYYFHFVTRDQVAQVLLAIN